MKKDATIQIQENATAEQHPKELPARVYASMNRRMMAAFIDIIIVFLLFAPVTNWLIHALFNAPDLFELGAEYINNKPDNTIVVSEAINYFEQHNAILPYIMTQVCSVVAVSAYCIIFWWKQGATLGKMLLRIKVIDIKTGGPLTLRQSCMRIVGYMFSTLTFCLGFIMMHFQKEHRGLHDIVASTAVIVTE